MATRQSTAAARTPFYGDIARLKKPIEENVESGTPAGKAKFVYPGAAGDLMPSRGDPSNPNYLRRGPSADEARSRFPSDLWRSPMGGEVGILGMGSAAQSLGLSTRRRRTSAGL